MKGAAAAVIEFNQNILGIEPRKLEPMPENEAKHLVKCLNEEVNDEFMEGQTKGDLVDCVDALIDAMYFALGGLYKMGLSAHQIEACFLAVHQANMEKKKGVVAGRAVEGAVDAIKPAEWKSPEQRIAEILFETE